MLQHQRQPESGGTTTLCVENSEPPKLPQGRDSKPPKLPQGGDSKPPKLAQGGDSEPPKPPQGEDKQTTSQPAAEVQSHDVSSSQSPTSSTDEGINTTLTANSQTPSGAKLLDIDIKKNGAAASAEQGLCLVVCSSKATCASKFNTVILPFYFILYAEYS